MKNYLKIRVRRDTMNSELVWFLYKESQISYICRTVIVALALLYHINIISSNSRNSWHSSFSISEFCIQCSSLWTTQLRIFTWLTASYHSCPNLNTTSLDFLYHIRQGSVLYSSHFLAHLLSFSYSFLHILGIIRRYCQIYRGFPGGASGKEPTCQCGQI